MPETRYINKQSGIFYNAVNVFKTPLPFYGTQIIDPFLKSRISANHEKGLEFQPIVKSLYSLIFLQCRISFAGNIYSLDFDTEGQQSIFNKSFFLNMFLKYCVFLGLIYLFVFISELYIILVLQYNIPGTNIY